MRDLTIDELNSVSGGKCTCGSGAGCTKKIVTKAGDMGISKTYNCDGLVDWQWWVL